jgi:hypothetical protein
VKNVVYTEPTNDQGLFVIESVVDSRTHHKKTDYLIKWAGFSDTENTWESATNLCCARLIAQFRQAKKRGHSPRKL